MQAKRDIKVCETSGSSMTAAASMYAWGEFLQHHPILLAAWVTAVLGILLGSVLIPLLWTGAFEHGINDPARGTEDANGTFTTRFS